MTGRIYHTVSILLAAVSLLTGCTGGKSSEPETPSAQTQTTAAQNAPPQDAAAEITTAAETQSAEPDDPPEARVPVPDADIIMEPVQPEQAEQPGESAQPEQPMVTGPWIEFDS
ncbi:MAG: hypothetical protein J5753_01805 [Oscillospiraceae bacterium]|nr:hypothetical protein [Oscillospiraceae bacterium]